MTEEVSRDAVEILRHYIGYIQTVRSDELERHPYLPEIERVTDELDRLAHLPTDLSEERAREIYAAELERRGAGHSFIRCGADNLWTEAVYPAMQQYAAGLQGENRILRERLNGVLFAIGQPLDCDGKPFGDTQ